MNCASNESGFSILEVLIAAAMLMVLALGIAQQSNMIDVMALQTEAKMDFYDFRTSIAIALSKRPACVQTLGGKLLSGGPAITKIVEGYQDFATAGNPWVFTDVYIVGDLTKLFRGSFSLESLALQGSVAPGNTGQAALLVGMRDRRRAGNAGTFTRQILLEVTLDGAGAITDCQAFVENAMAKPLLCDNPPLQCGSAVNYCSGELFANLASDCFCIGTKTSGTSATGIDCSAVGPTPTPSPSPT